MSLELLRKMEAAGFTFIAEGDSLKWPGPADILTDTDRAAIRANKPALLAIVKLREAAAARVTASGHIACDRELSALWRAAIEACAPDAVDICGNVTARSFDAGAAYDPAAARVEAERLFAAGLVSLEQFNNLIGYADAADRAATQAPDVAERMAA